MLKFKFLVALPLFVLALSYPLFLVSPSTYIIWSYTSRIYISIPDSVVSQFLFSILASFSNIKILNLQICVFVFTDAAAHQYLYFIFVVTGFSINQKIYVILRKDSDDKLRE